MSRVIFSIQHPAHVHLFRNAIKELQQEGNEVRVYAREKEMTGELLDLYNIDHEMLAPAFDSFLGLLKVELQYEYQLTRKAFKFDPDVMVAMGGVAISRPALISGSRCLVLTDTEHATLQNTLAFPFADRILTPECYQGDIGSKQVRYPGYHELAYLHPNRFDPDETILEEAGVNREDTLVLLRLVSWSAVHDVGDSGIENVVDVVNRLEDTGAKVLITSEGSLPESLERRRLNVAPDRIHHLMYYSDLFIGESATMATESAVLGTPSVFISSSRRGYTDELEEKFGLVFNYSGPDRQSNGLNRAISILENYDQTEWIQKRDRILDTKTDTTEVIIDQVNSLAMQGLSD
ncbi:DUF354 domain-containing protein [Halorubrum gandharaense]